MESKIITNLINLTELNGINKLVNLYSKCNMNVKTDMDEMNLNKTQLSRLDDLTKEQIVSVFSYGSLELCNPSHMFEDSNIETFTSKGDVILSGNASSMFEMATFFDSDLSRWNVNDVTNMSRMFTDSKLFKSDLSRWNVSKVNDMKHMFDQALHFNSDLSEWDVSQVTNMNNMFHNARHFNSDLSEWDVSQVTDMSYMFYYTLDFNSDLSEWVTPKIGDRNYSRQGCKNKIEYLFGIQSKLT